MNELHGRLDEEGFRGAGVTVRLRSVGAAAPANVVLGVRPQHVWGAPEPPPEERIRLGRGRVEFVEHLGSESFAFVTLGSSTLAVEVDAGRRYAAGAELELGILPGKAHLFDEETGDRVAATLVAPGRRGEVAV
jgi:ABC-type sugar transport system ATPase subunit